MITNKTFHGVNLPKKGLGISPLKYKLAKKQVQIPIRSIMRLPSVKKPISIEYKNYQLGQLIGEGAFSKVYMAKRMTDNIKCVIKLIQKTKIQTQQRKKAFKRQLQALSLPKHKNLISAIDQFQTTTQYAIVMQYFSSQSLTQYIKIHRPLDNSLLQKITKQICQGLIYLHSHGISHRDIKTDNLLINQQGELKIIDFGFATTQQLDQVVIAGTPKFMAPELISRKNYDPLKADIWAFGIMLYWMALGYFPQDANPKKKKMTMKKWQDFTLHFPVDINPGLQYLIRKMLNENPKQRIQLQSILEDTWLKPKLFKDQIQKLRQSKNISATVFI